MKPLFLIECHFNTFQFPSILVLESGNFVVTNLFSSIFSLQSSVMMMMVLSFDFFANHFDWDGLRYFIVALPEPSI